jgi:hypothetical protein
LLLLRIIVLLSASIALAEDYSPVYLDEYDPENVDLEDSLDYKYSEPGRFTFDGDLRAGYFDAEVEQRDASTDNNEEVIARIRYGVNFGFTEHARLKARLATTCSDSSCNPNFDVSSTPANGDATDEGDIVLDELYLDFFQRGRFDVALGRMQTRLATHGGVFVSSLTRLTSPNVAINWTDGLALRYITDHGWNSHAILQYNDSKGSSTLARSPLDFEADNSRVSGFYSLENRKTWGPFIQRAVDITYMPSALLKEGDRAGPTEDYWTVVGRFATQWPQNPSADSLVISGELGYAPETPTEQAVSTGTNGDVDGLAWHLEASWMNFKPGHSIGVNYGYTSAGWLLSPSYRANEDAVTLRYHWRPIRRLQLEAQARWREDNEPLLNTEQKRDTFDWRIRLTWMFETVSTH